MCPESFETALMKTVAYKAGISSLRLLLVLAVHSCVRCIVIPGPLYWEAVL